MRVALYPRVSTDEQADHGFSIDLQKERLIAFCHAQGWDDFRLYIDDGYSGTNMNRPALKRLIRHVEEKSIDMVVVYKLDRLGRNQKDVLYLLEDVFEKNGVAFKSATEPFDTSTPLGKAMIGILAVFAQLERDMIVERTTSGRRQRVSKGMWYGGPTPFGYHWNKEAQQLEVIPEEARLLQEMYKRYLQGQSRLAIAEWVSERSTARVFDHSTVRDYLSRPIYMGKLTNAGALVDGKHEAIIEADTWYAVQREIDKRKEGYPALGDFLLTGLLTCGVCGAGIVHVSRTTKKYGKVYSYSLYACKNQHVRAKDRNNNCTLGYPRRADIEEYVIKQIKEISRKPKKIQDIIKRKTEIAPDYNLAKSLQQKITKVTAGLDNLYDAIQTGEIKASAVSSRISMLEEERESFQRQLDDVKDDAPVYKDPNNLHFLIREIGDAWDYFTEEEQKMMIRKIVHKVTLHKDSEPEIAWNIVE